MKSSPPSISTPRVEPPSTCGTTTAPSAVPAAPQGQSSSSIKSTPSGFQDLFAQSVVTNSATTAAATPVQTKVLQTQQTAYVSGNVVGHPITGQPRVVTPAGRSGSPLTLTQIPQHQLGSLVKSPGSPLTVIKVASSGASGSGTPQTTPKIVYRTNSSGLLQVLQTSQANTPNVRTVIGQPLSPLVTQGIRVIRTPGSVAAATRLVSPSVRRLLTTSASSSPAASVSRLVAPSPTGIVPKVAVTERKPELTDRDVSRLWATDDLKLKKINSAPNMQYVSSYVCKYL